jgi:uncharacterized protein
LDYVRGVFRSLQTAALILLCVSPVACAAGRPKNAIAARFGTHTLWVEIADEEGERQKGLMFRHEMGEDAGMIFVFETPHRTSFWMKNTPLPLSIAYLDEEKKILNIENMAPYDERTQHFSNGDALYAVEAHQGWFEKRGIKAGDVVEFELPGTPRAKE